MSNTSYLWIVFAPVIFVVGTFGNLIIVLVVRRGSMRTSTTCVYVTYIAIFDLITLVSGMINEWLKVEDIINLEELHPFSCKCIKVFVYVSMDTAIWLVVLFTAERFIAICLPFKRRDTTYCQVRFINAYVVMCIVAGLILNGPTFFTRGAEYEIVNGTEVFKRNCGYVSASAREYEYRVKPWLILTFATVLPIIILIVCNSMVLYTLFRRRSVQRTQMNVVDSSQSDKLLKQITFMCVSVSFAFVIFIAPSVILLIGKVHWQDSESYKVTKSINNLLVYCNHSINCYLYLLTGKKFRDETLKFLSCGKEKINCVCCNIDCPVKTSLSESRSSEVPTAVTSVNHYSRDDSTTTLKTLSSTISDGKIRLMSYNSISSNA